MEIEIYNIPFRKSVEIMFFKETPEGRYRTKPMTIEWEKERPGEVYPKASLTVEGGDSETFLQVLAEALARHGVKTDKDAKIEGTLQATRYHLEDMREMLKLKGQKK